MGQQLRCCAARFARGAAALHCGSGPDSVWQYLRCLTLRLWGVLPSAINAQRAALQARQRLAISARGFACRFATYRHCFARAAPSSSKAHQLRFKESCSPNQALTHAVPAAAKHLWWPRAKCEGLWLEQESWTRVARQRAAQNWDGRLTHTVWRPARVALTRALRARSVRKHLVR